MQHLHLVVPASGSNRETVRQVLALGDKKLSPNDGDPAVTTLDDGKPVPVLLPVPVLHRLEDVTVEPGIDPDEPDADPALTQEECEALDRAEMLTDAEEADAIEAEVTAARVTGDQKRVTVPPKR
jgi:hypothetical protein